MADEYYQLLGVPKGADEGALKSAYRKKAMEFHPDRNPGDAKAEAKFKEINEAYEVLKDPQKRAAYDRFGKAAFQPGGPGASQRSSPRGGQGGGFGQQEGFDGTGFEDLFEDLMGGLFGGGGQATRRTRTARGGDLRYNLEVTLAEAFHGTTASVRFPTTISCTTCDGSGAKKGTRPVTCGTCNGSGTVQFRQGFFSMSRTCPDCEGSGQVIKDKCSDCHGSGRTRHTKNLQVNVPAGVTDGIRLRLAGEGEAGAHGGPAGDLYVFIQVAAHPIFTRDGTHLHLNVPIGVLDAMLGTSLELPTPDGGRTVLKVPAGTQPGQVLNLPGLGMPTLGRARERGDLRATIQVEVPTTLTKAQKEQLEQLRAGMPSGRHQQGFASRLKGFFGKA